MHSMREYIFSWPLSRATALAKARLRLEVFLERMWRRPCLCLINLPEAVTLKRAATALLGFSFVTVLPLGL